MTVRAYEYTDIVNLKWLDEEKLIEKVINLFSGDSRPPPSPDTDTTLEVIILSVTLHFIVDVMQERLNLKI